jgi:hypothetical protein
MPKGLIMEKVSMMPIGKGQERSIFAIIPFVPVGVDASQKSWITLDRIEAIVIYFGI